MRTDVLVHVGIYYYSFSNQHVGPRNKPRTLNHVGLYFESFFSFFFLTIVNENDENRTV